MIQQNNYYIGGHGNEPSGKRHKNKHRGGPEEPGPAEGHHKPKGKSTDVIGTAVFEKDGLEIKRVEGVSLRNFNELERRVR